MIMQYLLTEEEFEVNRTKQRNIEDATVLLMLAVRRSQAKFAAKNSIDIPMDEKNLIAERLMELSKAVTGDPLKLCERMSKIAQEENEERVNAS